MAATNRPAALNRTLLAVIGLILLAAGAFGLLLGLGVLRGVLPGLDPAAPLIPPGVGVQGWVPYATIVAATLIGLLCLRWLLAQALRRPTTGTWRLHHDPARGTTLLAADTVADAVAADIEAYPGVSKASAVLTGTRARPTLHLDVTTEENIPVTALRDRIAGHALPRLCRALGRDTVPAELLLRIDTAGPSTTRTR
ncbi:MAG: alkaline shock response membrane anchor protein AmaP [Pseudonocardia sp.]